MSQGLEVLVELRAANRGNADELDLPGFEISPHRVLQEFLLDEGNATARPVVRGTVSYRGLEDLRRDPRVVDVYLAAAISSCHSRSRAIQGTSIDTTRQSPS